MERLNQITAGYDWRREEVLAEKKRMLAALRARVAREYGALSDWEIMQVVAVEAEQKKCAECKGLPCPKETGANQEARMQVVEGYGLVITRGPCRHYQAWQKAQRVSKALVNANLPARYQQKTWQDYLVDANNEVAVRYGKACLQKRYGAYFYGEPGTGKTFLATLIGKEFSRAGLTVVFEKVPRLLDEFYSVYRGESQTNERAILQTLYSADLLILDDFGMEKPTRFAGTTLCKVLDARYDANGQEAFTTIITSNYPLERIQQELDNATDGRNYNGTRLVDRCRSICKPIYFKGNSRRR